MPNGTETCGHAMTGKGTPLKTVKSGSGLGTRLRHAVVYHLFKMTSINVEFKHAILLEVGKP